MSSDTSICRTGRGSESVLDAVRAEFARLPNCSLLPVTEGLVGLPHSVPDWLSLRRVLLDRGLPITTVDTVWVRLIQSSRTRGGDATVACAGMALPMLATLAAQLCAPWWGDHRDIDAAVLTEFLSALPDIDVDRPRVLFRLRWAAYRGGLARVKDDQDAPAPIGAIGETRLPGARGRIEPLDARPRPILRPDVGHPELLLAEAVADRVLTAEAAQLIAVTRLQRQPLTAVAAQRLDSYARLHKTRSRAERRLALWLADRVAEVNTDGCSEVERAALGTIAPASHRPRRPASRRTRRAVSNAGPDNGVRACGNGSGSRIRSERPEEVRPCA